jgi:hypothetical protein
VSTSTPPPYFPQNKLSPSDAKARKKFIFTLVGCGALIVIGVIALIVAVVIYLR